VLVGREAGPQELDALPSLPARHACYGRVFLSSFSSSVENLFIDVLIFGGCSTNVAIIRSAMCGLDWSNSTDADMSERVLLISWRMVESWWFSSATCSAVKVIG